jgi:hypothetical protein
MMQDMASRHEKFKSQLQENDTHVQVGASYFLFACSSRSECMRLGKNIHSEAKLTCFCPCHS